MAGLALVSFGAGCSGSDTNKTTTDATEPAQTATKPPPKNPPPPTPPDDSSSDPGSTADAPPACMDKNPFDATTVPYHSPATKPNSCTTDDIKFFNDYLKNNPQSSFQDLQDAVTKQSKTCSDCVFGSADDDKWAPIVSDDSGSTFNGGGCVALVSGKDACGKAYQQWNTCLNTVCASCSDQGDRSTCTNDAQNPGAPCGTASKALSDACGTKVNTYLKKCFGSGLGEVLNQSCGAVTSKDGGS
jgi:hypothetical protein